MHFDKHQCITMKHFLTFTFLVWIALSAGAQSITNVEAQYADGKVTVTYRLETSTPKDLFLSYSNDDGVTYKPCLSVSGDLKAQKTGNKQIIWNCLTDDVVIGTFVFKVSIEMFEMVFVQGGSFTMGCTSEQGGDCDRNEKPVHQVTVSDFYIGKYEVTQAEWKAVMGSYPSELHNTDCDNCPVDGVSWNDIQDFIRKLNALMGKNYRLPTEAEWEYAARGGSQSKGYKYSGSNNIDNVAWYYWNYMSGKRGTQGTTHPVGTKNPNELGIYDMSGNVWEWCSDRYGNYGAGAVTNPQGAVTGSDHVLRGGSWISHAPYCRVSTRSNHAPGDRNNNFGFRLAVSP